MLGLGMAGRGRVIGSSRARELGAGFLCLAAALKSSGDAGFGSLGMMGWMARVSLGLGQMPLTNSR